MVHSTPRVCGRVARDARDADPGQFILVTLRIVYNITTTGEPACVEISLTCIRTNC